MIGEGFTDKYEEDMYGAVQVAMVKCYSCNHSFPENRVVWTNPGPTCFGCMEIQRSEAELEAQS